MSEKLTSAANPRIKALAALRRKGRASGDARILIDGLREISRGIAAGLVLEELLYCPQLFDEPGPADLSTGAMIESARSHGARLFELPPHVFEKIRYGDRTGGLVAVAQRPQRGLGDLRLSSSPLLAVVEGVGKPGNLGAILRSADGAGVEGILVAESEIDVYGPNVIRASVSTVFRVPLVEVPAAQARAFLAERNIQLVAASPQGSHQYTDLDYSGPTAFVFGAEDRGLSETWAAAGVRAAKVPMLGLADSLNVATTAALFFYEAVRQRNSRLQP